MKPKVILTQRYQEEAIRLLQEEFDLIIVEGSGKTLVELLNEHPDTRALISFLSDPIDRTVIEPGKNLEIIANYAVGYNNIDYKYAISRGIAVTHTPDILTDATADLAMALILAVSRRIVEADEYLRQGKFTGWSANLLLGKELKGTTLGIIGMGRIGKATAIRAMGFGMNIIYYSRTRKPDLEKQYGFTYETFVNLLKKADVISPHFPASPDTRHLFNKDAFSLMKPDAIFINVARGDLVNERCLAEKLENNHLFGAGLDVYEYEPAITEKLKSLKNTVLLPHIGSATISARLGMARMTIASVKNKLAGLTPPHLIPECRSSIPGFSL